MNLSELLRSQVKPSLGCTEPVATGLAASIAYNALRGWIPTWLGGKTPYAPEYFDIQEILINVDRDVYKNSLAVGIPKTQNLYGIYNAVALGIFCNPDKELSLFQDSNEEKLALAKKLVEDNKIKIKVVDDWKGEADINILAIVKAKEGSHYHEGMTRIQHSHTNVTCIMKDGKTLYKKKEKPQSKGFDENMEELSKMSLKGILNLTESFSKEDMDYILEGIKMNERASDVGLRNRLGLQIGYMLQELMEEGVLANDVVTLAKIKTAAAADARMSGYDVSVMSCAGSGNQGCVATLPIVAVAEKFGRDDKKLIKAVGLSYLITSYVTYYSGYLSALCGCAVKAGIGATSGITYYLGGDLEKIGDAINNMAANITGIICDGAKLGCAKKLATSAGVAVESALLAMKGVKVPPTNGIVAKNPEDTIKNIGRVSKGMIQTDKSIVEIMESKGKYH